MFQEIERVTYLTVAEEDDLDLDSGNFIYLIVTDDDVIHYDRDPTLLPRVDAGPEAESEPQKNSYENVEKTVKDSQRPEFTNESASSEVPKDSTNRVEENSHDSAAKERDLLEDFSLKDDPDYDPESWYELDDEHECDSELDVDGVTETAGEFSRERSFACGPCNKSYVSEKTLKAHEKAVHGKQHHKTPPGEVVGTCEICGATFMSKHSLILHTRYVHSTDLPFVCLTCGKRCKTKALLYSHERTHTGEGRKVCQICGKSQYYLKKHMRVHTGERPYTCDTCGMGFKGKSDMYRHQVVHTGARPYACNVPGCGKTFKQSGILKRHKDDKHPGWKDLYPSKPFQKYHRRGQPWTPKHPKKCSLCGKQVKCLKMHLRFHEKQELKKHVSITSDAKLFTCEDCGKPFQTPGELNSHKNCHSGERTLDDKRSEDTKKDGDGAKTKGPDSETLVTNGGLRMEDTSFTEDANLLGDPESSSGIEKRPRSHRRRSRRPWTHSDDFVWGTNDELEISDVELDDRDLPTDMVSVDGAPFINESCGQTFKVRGELNGQKKSQPYDTKEKCSFCGLFFFRINTHISRKHKNPIAHQENGILCSNASTSKRSANVGVSRDLMEIDRNVPVAHKQMESTSENVTNRETVILNLVGENSTNPTLYGLSNPGNQLNMIDSGNLATGFTANWKMSTDDDVFTMSEKESKEKFIVIDDHGTGSLQAGDVPLISCYICNSIHHDVSALEVHFSRFHPSNDVRFQMISHIESSDGFLTQHSTFPLVEDPISWNDVLQPSLRIRTCNLSARCSNISIENLVVAVEKDHMYSTQKSSKSDDISQVATANPPEKLPRKNTHWKADRHPKHGESSEQLKKYLIRLILSDPQIPRVVLNRLEDQGMKENEDLQDADLENTAEAFVDSKAPSMCELGFRDPEKSKGRFGGVQEIVETTQTMSCSKTIQMDGTRNFELSSMLVAGSNVSEVEVSNGKFNDFLLGTVVEEFEPSSSSVDTHFVLSSVDGDLSTTSMNRIGASGTKYDGPDEETFAKASEIPSFVVDHHSNDHQRGECSICFAIYQEDRGNSTKPSSEVVCLKSSNRSEACAKVRLGARIHSLQVSEALENSVIFSDPSKIPKVNYHMDIEGKEKASRLSENSSNNDDPEDEPVTNDVDVPKVEQESDRMDSEAPHRNVKTVHTPNGPKPYACGYCWKRFFCKYSLKKHERNIHQAKNGKREVKPPISCDICGAKYITKNSMTLHSSRHSDVAPFVCRSCGKAFKTSDELDLHSKIHTRERKPCTICGVHFLNLQHHIRTKHKYVSDEPVGTCDICGATFMSKHSLILHTRYVHSTDLPFVCLTCGKRCKTKALLYSHERTHTGEGRKVCQICGKSQYYLKKHMRVHTGERPYTCDTCGMGFKGKSDMYRHQVVHTGARPYACNVPGCGKTFKQSGILKRHKDDKHPGWKDLYPSKSVHKYYKRGRCWTPKKPANVSPPGTIDSTKQQMESVEVTT